jgi:hypothetical protein
MSSRHSASQPHPTRANAINSSVRPFLYQEVTLFCGRNLSIDLWFEIARQYVRPPRIERPDAPALPVATIWPRCPWWSPTWSATIRPSHLPAADRPGDQSVGAIATGARQRGCGGARSPPGFSATPKRSAVKARLPSPRRIEAGRAARAACCLDGCFDNRRILRDSLYQSTGENDRFCIRGIFAGQWLPQ